MMSEDYLRQANELWFAGQSHQALKLYVLAVSALPKDATATLTVNVKSAYALCLCDVGDFEQALALYPQLERLCQDGGLDETMVVRQWAKALEQVGSFSLARATYEKVSPDALTSQQDRLKWEHAMGLLNWRDGRLTEAAANLASATDAMPSDITEASYVLAVLGNDALLSLELGNAPRAYRLVERMIDIRATVKAIPLGSEVNLIKVRAALAQRRGDYAQEAQILKDGAKLIEECNPDEWMRKLDLIGDYTAASQRAGLSENAVSYLSDLCKSAPFSLVWIGCFMLAQVQIEILDPSGAKDSIITVLASFVGSGSAESEVEVIATLAGLAHISGKRPASILLGKLTLKYLAEISHAFEDDALRKIVAKADKLTQQTILHLREAGRYEEALSLDQFFDRVQRYALVLRKPATEAMAFQPIPFDRAESRAVAGWLAGRENLVLLRSAAQQKKAMHAAGELVDQLLNFETSSGLAQRAIEVTPTTGRNLRLSFVPSGDVCQVHYQWSDRSRVSQINISARSFFSKVATLREAVADSEAWRASAAELYRYLIQPVAEELDKIDCLEIDGSGVLGRIPMSLLTDSSTCLVQRVAIKYVISATPGRRDGAKRSGLAHFAAFQTGPLATRPKVLEDTDDTIGPKAFIQGRAFTRASLLKQLQMKPAYLSIATHLDTEPTRPDLSSLLLGTELPLYLADFGDSAFDLNGIDVALFATCSSGLNDATHTQGTSLAGLVLEKGARSFVGTLWDISETTAARFVDTFWQALQTDPSQAPATVLARLQSSNAARANQSGLAAVAAGGIGSPSHLLRPEDWAAFAVFENRNAVQHAVQSNEVKVDR